EPVNGEVRSLDLETKTTDERTSYYVKIEYSYTYDATPFTGSRLGYGWASGTRGMNARPGASSRTWNPAIRSSCTSTGAIPAVRCCSPTPPVSSVSKRSS